ncbi:hypothetical protein DH2020_001494 [Rehmannia glutinosa]|uniref:C2H2-type domain-containing protein n=1 Tax=Rehmannia glutinosa TaxID=99300 RepID=A0ABR0Y085_REHGL
MFPAVISNSASHVSEDASNIVSSGSRVHDFGTLNSMLQINSVNPSQQQPQKSKKKRNLPGNPDPDAEVIALSPKTLLATNRFVCEICNKGFQRDQNLQLHRRGHNLPWKLKQRNNKENRKRAYVCPEPTCLHHHPSRALGDLTGIKKHYCRKHGEKKWKCEKCSKIYAVQSDWKAHSKTCGTREYRCDCGTLFSSGNQRVHATVNLFLHETFANWKDSFITHRAFCDALAEERTSTPPRARIRRRCFRHRATQKAATVGAGARGHVGSTMAHYDMHVAWQKKEDDDDRFTRDFLGLTGEQCGGGGGGEFPGGLKFPAYDRDHNSLLKHNNHGFGFTETCSGWGNC